MHSDHYPDRAVLRNRLRESLPAAFLTRFAPAPTGPLHLGHAVNMVWIWSVARAFDGRVVLRIEDHDRSRARASWEQGILDVLDWLELSPDIGATASYRASAPHPLRQSDRHARYAEALHRLATSTPVYPCRCSRREIADLSTTPADELRYTGTCRHLSLDPVQFVARRAQLPEEWVEFDDLRLGSQRQQPSAQCGDLLVRDRIGQWTYQFAVVVDDLEQQIDVIIRGTDLLASTGRQRLLARLLGATRLPQLLHHGLIRHPDGTKLSKSRGDSGLFELRDAGWSAERVLGYAAHLAGLQRTDRALPADALAELWDDGSGPRTEAQ
jgi:glutamyl/glutaminyl-tRNA synthetase